ncbi:hypothetical protein HG530_013310 [Fusarium avenaceum]|nr:hypothetical protein HG530_013310 [Fusarium avenaceum]
MASTEQENAAKTSHTHLVMVILVVAFAISVSILVVSLRLWCRRAMKLVYWDDLAAVMSMLCVIALGSGFLALIPRGLNSPTGKIPAHKVVSFYKCTYFVTLFYGQGLYWAKMTFLLLYYRVLCLSYWRWTYFGAIVMLTLWNISRILVYFLNCIPMEAIWNRDIKGKCVPDRLEVAYILAGINIFSDLAIAVLPLPVIWNLNLRRSQKIALSGLFGLGCFPITLAIVRIKWVETWSSSTWDIIRPNLWALAEVTSALTCACIPTYKPLLLGISEVARQHKRSTNGFVLEEHGSDSEAGLRAGSAGSEASCIQKPKHALLYGTQTYITAEHNEWRFTMASLCNYSRPDPQIAQGLVHQGAGKLFPYNPEFYDNASGLYGPGAIYCWYMLLVSVVASWSFHQAGHGSLKDLGLSSDLIGGLAYPVFAATDLLVQSIRMRGMDHRAVAILCLRYPKDELDDYGPFDDVEIDLHRIPSDILDFGQHVVDITGPLTICYTATTFLFILYMFFCYSVDLDGKRDWRPIPAVRWVIYVVYGYILLILTVFHLSLDNRSASFFIFFMETVIPGEIIMGYLSILTTTIILIWSLAMLVWAVVDKDRGQAIEALKNIGCALCLMILLASPPMLLVCLKELSTMPDLGIRVSERDQLATLIVGVFTLSLTLFDIGHHFYQKLNGREVTEESMEMLPASEV